MIKKVFLFILVFSLVNSQAFARRAAAPSKACNSNCRVIQGAIEMYDMDHDKSYDSGVILIDPKGTGLEHYYKPIYLPDSKCHYRYDLKESLVYCEYHGSPDGVIKPSEEYNRELKRKEFRKFIDSLIPIGIVIVFGTGIWAVIPTKKKKEA